MNKKILFVTYGGGHAKMVVPVLRALKDYSAVQCETLALTTAGPLFKRENLPYKGFKDFVREGDEASLAWGREAARDMHMPGSGIEEDESIAYLGLSYGDMVTRLGAQEAARQWEQDKRQAFMPLTVMERVFDDFKPDMVITTNSPRSERAAVEIAKQRGIPSLSMVDLFGYVDFHVLDADYLTALNEIARHNLLKGGVRIPPEHIFVTGNPAFDPVFEYRGPVNNEWRAAHYPHIRTKHALLWADVPGYFEPGSHALHVRDRDEVLLDLDRMLHACMAEDCALLVRPHPSQDVAMFKDWLAAHTGHAFYAGDVALYPLLSAVDVVAAYNSTVTVEALLMGRKVMQPKYQPGESDMPLGPWDLAWQADAPELLQTTLHEALHDAPAWARKCEAIARLLPQTRATPQIASHILRILGLNA